MIISAKNKQSTISSMTTHVVSSTAKKAILYGVAIEVNNSMQVMKSSQELIN
jgi:hypothetical protein